MTTTRRVIRLDAIWRMGLALEGTEKGATWGTPALKRNGKVFACVPTHKSAESQSLVVRTTWEARDQFLTEAPDIFYLPDHYKGYPFVLVRLRVIARDALQDLLTTGWRLAGDKPVKRTRSSSASRR